MKLLAIDPATECGWALENDFYGTWDLSIRRDESAGMRLIRFRAKLKEIHAVESLEVIGFERPGGRNYSALMSHSKLQGIVETFCIDNGIEYRGYSAGEIKKFATGKGNSNKEAMIHAARIKLGYPGKNDNEADALWILNLLKRDVNI